MFTTNSNETSFEAVRELCKTVVRRAGSFLGNEEDWPPLLFVENGYDIRAEPLYEYPIRTSEQRERLVEVVLPDLIRQHDGICAVFAFPAWTTAYEGNVDESQFRQFNRIEVVALLVVDARHCEFWAATVHRDGRHPTLKPWALFAGETVSDLAAVLRQAVCPQG